MLTYKKSECKNCKFSFVYEVCEKIVHLHVFWYHYVHSMTEGFLELVQSMSLESDGKWSILNLKLQ